MKKPLAALNAWLLCAAAASASGTTMLYSEPAEGLYIVRHEPLAQALRESDRLCADYAQRQERADQVSRAAAAAPLKKTLQREKASITESARRLMGECLNADKLAKKALCDLFGPKTVDRLQKAAAFEDMVYIQLLPEAPAHFEALR